MNKMNHARTFFTLLVFLFLVGCTSNEIIVNNVEEREANEIVVFLASKSIEAQKVIAPSAGIGAQGPSNLFNITVANDRATDAMAILNRYGLPRRRGTNLLELFAAKGLMSSEREETIRYQAGLGEELKNTIRKFDGVLDADVQISFPPAETTPGVTPPKTTASVYIKHQGIAEDPNSHLETKIKRLVAASITNLHYDDVTVVTDRSRFTDIVLEPNGEPISNMAHGQTYASIWNIVMTKSSLSRFRWIFFSLMIALLLFGTALGWMLYKFYPQMQLPFLKKKQPTSPSNETEPMT